MPIVAPRLFVVDHPKIPDQRGELSFVEQIRHRWLLISFPVPRRRQRGDKHAGWGQCAHYVGEQKPIQVVKDKNDVPRSLGKRVLFQVDLDCRQPHPRPRPVVGGAAQRDIGYIGDRRVKAAPGQHNGVAAGPSRNVQSLSLAGKQVPHLEKESGRLGQHPVTAVFQVPSFFVVGGHSGRSQVMPQPWCGNRSDATRWRTAGRIVLTGAMTQLFDLTGSVAVVTGGNGGIGLGMAGGLAAAGASVCIWGRNPDKNESAEEQLIAHGGEAHAIRCDVSDEESVALAFEETLTVFGKVDSCFANAGVGAGVTRFDEMTTNEWRHVLAVNLDGVFFTLRQAVAHMKQRGEGGSLVATASVAALHGMPRGEHYAATKAAVTAMIRGLAVEYGRHGIRANSVLPGWVKTDMSKPVTAGGAIADAVLGRTPTGRFGLPEDFAGIAVYLASDASKWHTGDQILIDGGYTKY